MTTLSGTGDRASCIRELPAGAGGSAASEEAPRGRGGKCQILEAVENETPHFGVLTNRPTMGVMPPPRPVLLVPPNVAFVGRGVQHACFTWSLLVAQVLAAE